MVQATSLPKPSRYATLSLASILFLSACGRKADPIPRPRVEARACAVHWTGLRTLEIRLPTKDQRGTKLVGFERVAVYYLPMGHARPRPEEVITRGEVVMERRRPDLPSPGALLVMNLTEVNRPAGWIVVSAIRVGNVVGAPSETLPWMDPGI